MKLKNMDDPGLIKHIKSTMTEIYARVEVEDFDKFRDYAEATVSATQHGRHKYYAIAAIIAVIIFVMLPAAWLIQQQRYTPDTGPAGKVNAVINADDDESEKIITLDKAYLTATALITPTDFLGYPEASRVMNQPIRITTYDPINMELTP